MAFPVPRQKPHPQDNCPTQMGHCNIRPPPIITLPGRVHVEKGSSLGLEESEYKQPLETSI